MRIVGTDPGWPAASADLSMAFDALGRMTNMVDGVGATRYAYTSAGRLESEDGPWDNDTVSYSHFQNGLRASVSLPTAGAATWRQTYAWDAGNRLTNITSGAGGFAYLYETTVGAAQTPAASLIDKILLPGGTAIFKAHDSVGRVVNTSLMDTSTNALNMHAYNYNLAGQRTKQTFTDGNYVDYTYDDIGQLKTAIDKETGGAGRLHEQMGYAYDAAGNLNVRTNNALVQTFNVNSRNELTTASRTGTLTVAGKAARPSLTVSVSVNGQSASVYDDLTFARAGFSLADGTNQFTAIATDDASQSATNDITAFLPASPAYQYDDNGNLISDGHRAFAYDDENQLSSVLVTNAWKSEFAYDGKMRRRIRKEYHWQGGDWTQTGEVRYVYSGNLVIQERDDENNATVTYTRGPDLSGGFEGAGGIGGLLARTAHQTGPDYHACYHADANGNICAIVNAQEAIVARYQYDPFGNLFAKSGFLADANLYRFSSKEFHAPSGLVYSLYRYYEPRLKRWLNRDPLGEDGGINLFSFVGNDPTAKNDQFGLQPTNDGSGGQILTITTINPPPWLELGIANPAILPGSQMGPSSFTGSGNGAPAFTIPPPNAVKCTPGEINGKVVFKTVTIDCPCTGPTKITCRSFQRCVQYGGSIHPTNPTTFYTAWEDQTVCDDCPEFAL